jgi:hypothetical protein
MTFSSYELVPADVQQALLKAYDEQRSSDALPPTRKSNLHFPIVKRVSPEALSFFR